MDILGTAGSLYAGMEVKEPRGLSRWFRTPEIRPCFLSSPHLLVIGQPRLTEDLVLNPQAYFALKRGEQVISNHTAPAALHQRLLMAQRLGKVSKVSAVAVLQGEPLTSGLRQLLSHYSNLSLLVIDPLAHLKRVLTSEIPMLRQHLVWLLAPREPQRQHDLMPPLSQARSWDEFTGQRASYPPGRVLPDWHSADLIQLDPFTSERDFHPHLLLLNDFLETQYLDRETELYRTLRPLTLHLDLGRLPWAAPYLSRQLDLIRQMRGQVVLNMSDPPHSDHPAQHLRRGLAATLQLTRRLDHQAHLHVGQHSATGLTVFTPLLNQRYLHRHLPQPYFQDFTQTLSLSLPN